MPRLVAALILALAPAPAGADSLVATRTIRAQTLIAPGDVAIVAAVHPGTLSRPAEAVGFEARHTIYAGQPIHRGALAAPALVERNQIVRLVFAAGGLAIETEGRALARGAEGELIRVMNLASRTTLSGRIAGPGLVRVGAGA